jgi:hypothetical protein
VSDLAVLDPGVDPGEDPVPGDDDRAGSAAPGEGTGGGGGRIWSWLRPRVTDPHTIMTALVVAACTVFVFVQMQPSQIFKETTPAGGDMGAHVWLPAYIKRELLPHFQIFGWTMDWYAGFPALSYYFPLPMVAIAVISYVVPYDVTFKLVAVSGIVTLPLACWAFGRLARMRFPGPACLAVASVPFLFGREFTIYGGNIASTMAGEFSFSISLSFAVLFLGLVARGLDTGRNRAIAAVVLACCGMSHILPLFFAIGGAAVLTAMRLRLRAVRWTLPVLVVGGLLISFWALPFEYRLPYATNMGYGKITTYLDTLFPHGDTWLFVLAGVGGILALARRNRIGVFLLLMSALAVFVFRFAPNARLWNARVLPFWFLMLYLLVGVAFAEAGSLVAGELFVDHRWVSRRSLVPIPVVTVLVALIWTGFPLRILPFGHTLAAGKYDWLGITSSDSSYVPDWISWNFSGYQSPAKSSRTTYFALIDAMKKLGQTPGDGCGRAMYEYEPAINDMGTPDALMLLPYWTNGCIGSMEGLYYESSATTPYHFLNVSELSAQPSDPMRGLDYAASPNIVEGIEHLQMFGVKYFMAVTPSVQRAAAADSSLQYLTAVGPYPTDVTNSSNQNVIQNQTWKIYKILDSPLVEPLTNQPVVMRDVAGSTAWLAASQAWYLDPSRWNVYETASGPSTWARVSASDAHPPVRPEPPVSVTDIHQGEESISFDVDQTGVPVLVKTSYFPNWHVSGASAIYRVTPNLMVVVPSAHHVSFTYGYTPIDWLGLSLTVVGIGGVVVLWRRRRADVLPGRHLAGAAAGPLPFDTHGPSDARTSRPARRPRASGRDWPADTWDDLPSWPEPRPWSEDHPADPDAPGGPEISGGPGAVTASAAGADAPPEAGPDDRPGPGGLDRPRRAAPGETVEGGTATT